MTPLTVVFLVQILIFGFSCSLPEEQENDEETAKQAVETAAAEVPVEELPEDLPAENVKAQGDQLNAFRESAQVCGSVTYAAANPVSWNRRLYDAAKRHSEDMASTGKVEHAGSDGSTPFQRAEAAGYRYQGLAENVAGKMTLFTDAFAGWVKSTGHCVNMMRPQVSEYAVGESQGYWTLLLAAPQ